MELYECAMTGNFFYTNLPADKKTWTASKDLRVMRSGITGEQAIYEIDDGFKEYLSKFFEIKEASYHFVQRYSDEFSTLNLVETDIFIDRRIGDTKPVYLINKEGEELLILKQDIKGVNYKFSFSFKNGQYTLEETEQKQGKFIDGKELLK